MKVQTLLFALLTFLTLNLFGQKERLKGDTSRFLCKSDSIYHFQINALVEQKVEGIITIRYDYDNGRVEEGETHIFWMKGSVQKVRSYNGCDNIRKDKTKDFPVDSIFQLYNDLQVDTVKSRKIKRRLWFSHSMGYNTSVYLPGKNQRFRVSTFNLNDLDYSIKNNSTEFIDPRTMFVEAILRIMKDSP